jgi:signal transduction histidine kinase
VTTAVVLLRRIGQARPPRRRLLAILYGYGAFVLVVTPVTGVAFAAWWPQAVFIRGVIQIGLLAVLPVVVLGVFLAGEFSKTTELESLGSWLGESEGSRAPIQEALAEALGDATLSVAYWSTELHSWVDVDGLAVPDVPLAEDRARYDLMFARVPVARIDYDGTVPRDLREVERAASLVALALERGRLTAELRAQRQAVIESRERVLDAADAERRRISRGLHDGLQARLLLLGIDADRLAAGSDGEMLERATALRDDLDSAAAELRAVVSNLVPPALIELGVVGAVEELIESMPIPVESDFDVPDRIGVGVEMTAYLVVAEALSNIIKHSGASACAVTVRVDDDDGQGEGLLVVTIFDNGVGLPKARKASRARPGGTGLTGITDRVAASGGRIDISTGLDGGVRVWAAIPFSRAG